MAVVCGRYPYMVSRLSTRIVVTHPSAQSDASPLSGALSIPVGFAPMLPTSCNHVPRASLPVSFHSGVPVRSFAAHPSTPILSSMFSRVFGSGRRLPLVCAAANQHSRFVNAYLLSAVRGWVPLRPVLLWRWPYPFGKSSLSYELNTNFLRPGCSVLGFALAASV